MASVHHRQEGHFQKSLTSSVPKRPQLFRKITAQLLVTLSLVWEGDKVFYQKIRVHKM